MKKIIVNIVIAILLLTAGFTVLQGIKYRVANTEFTACAVNGDARITYVGGNILRESVIYRVNDNGRVVGVHEEKFRGIRKELYQKQIVDICVDGSSVYYLAAAHDENGQYYYKLVELNTVLASQGALLSADFEKELTASRIEVVQEHAYLTMLSADRRTAYVYLADLSKKEKNWELLSQQSAREGRYFIEACYTGAVLQAGYDNETYVYFSGDLENDLASEDNRLIERRTLLEEHPVSISSVQILFRVMDKVVIQNILLAVFFIAVNIILYLMISSRSYALRQLALLEFSMFMLIAANIAFCMWINSANIERTYLESVKLSLDFFDESFGSSNAYFLDAGNYFNSEDYCRAYDELADFAYKSGCTKEIFLVHAENGNRQVMAALNSYRALAADKYLTARVNEMMETAEATSVTQYEKQNIYGDSYGVYVLPLREKTVTRKFLVAVVSMDIAASRNNAFRNFMIFMGLAVLVIASAGCVVVVRLMTRDIREFGNAMLENTEEALQKRKPAVHSNEIELMWNSLAELIRRYEKVSYGKYLILQAYYRFAPRGIEQMLGKDSILDVSIGDRVTVDGVMGLLSFKGSRKYEEKGYLETVTADLEAIGKHQTEQGGILISKDGSMTAFSFLFMGDSMKAVKFGINIIQEFAKGMALQTEEVFVLLHKDRIMYGVSGNENQTFPLVVSPESEALMEFVGPLRRLDAGLIVTESVRLTADIRTSSRYIGYVSLKKTGKKLKLYQVLDAYGVSKRSRFLACNDAFAEALSYFYKDDFYRARNGFSDIIKNNASDEIARWYLFICEGFLNGGGGKPRYGLFEE